MFEYLPASLDYDQNEELVFGFYEFVRSFRVFVVCDRPLFPSVKLFFFFCKIKI